MCDQSGNQLKYIYYFSFYNLSSPSTRYRAKYPLEYLFKYHKIAYTHTFPSYNAGHIFRFLVIYSSVLLFRKPNSIIIFQKIYTSGVYANLLKILLLLRPSNTYYDIDDAEYLRFPSKNIHFFMKKCNKVFVGSRALLNYAFEFNPNVILATSPIPKTYNPKKQKNNTLSLGWIGDYGKGFDNAIAYSHRTSLKQLFFPALKQINFPVHLTLLGVHSINDKTEIENYFAAHSNITLTIQLDINWNNEALLHQYISTFDFGISPLIDHEFIRAKSAFKLKQYFASGIPALASPVGENNTFLEDRVNGFFCNTVADFTHKIKLVNELTQHEYQTLAKNALATTKQFDLAHYSNILMT